MNNIAPLTGFRPPRSLVLVGMMGAGKSSIGRLLAERLALPFHDADLLIEARTGMTISDIFQQQGEPAFRQLEHDIITELLSRPELQVLATGGGAFVQPRNHDFIQSHALSVWLKADLDTLHTRTARRNTRPLLQGADPRGKLAELLAAREPIYSTAHLTIAVDDSPLDITTERVLGAVKQYAEYAA